MCYFGSQYTSMIKPKPKDVLLPKNTLTFCLELSKSVLDQSSWVLMAIVCPCRLNPVFGWKGQREDRKKSLQLIFIFNPSSFLYLSLSRTHLHAHSSLSLFLTHTLICLSHMRHTHSCTHSFLSHRWKKWAGPLLLFLCCNLLHTPPTRTHSTKSASPCKATSCQMKRTFWLQVSSNNFNV